MNTKFLGLNNELTHISNNGNFGVLTRCMLSLAMLFSEICKTISDHRGDLMINRTKEVEITLCKVHDLT